jgi:thiol:disulfide interchange protein
MMNWAHTLASIGMWTAAGVQSGLVWAQANTPATATLYSTVQPEEVRALIRVELEPGWHLYHKELGPPDAVGKKTVVTFGGTGIEWGETVFPQPKRLEQPGLGADGKDTWIWGHEGRFDLTATGKRSSNAEPEVLGATIVGLICKDDGMCIPYRVELTSSGPIPENRADHADPIGLGSFLLLAVVGGLFTLLMPCTYPMIPITLSFFTKQADARGGHVLPLALAYGAGIVGVFVLIGVVLGSLIIPFATNPWTNLIIGVLFVVFALTLFGAFELPVPSFLLNAAGGASQSGGLLGVFLMGTLLVVTSFTCTVPFVGSLLSVGAQQGEKLKIALGMAVYGLTMAIPFVFLALVPKRIGSLPRSGEWMHHLKVFLGFVEIAAALKFLSNSDLVWSWGVLTRELFLILWFGIFLAAALYLFGLIRLHGDGAEIGPTRLTGALMTLLFSLYCGYGALGHELDSVMTAIAPNYSKPRVGLVATAPGQVTSAPTRHPVVTDDFEAARQRALAEKKRLLVNFTGHT